MPTVRKVHTAWARHIVQHLEARGRPSEPILRQVGLDPRAVGDHEGRIPFAKQAVLFQAVAAHLGDPCFGLHLGSSVDPLEVGVVGYLGSSSATLGESLRNISSYLLVATEGARAELALEDRLAIFSMEIVDPDASAQQQITEFGLALILSFMRQITGRRLIPEWVELRHARKDHLEEFARYFGAPVRFGQQKSAVVLARRQLALASKAADQRLLRILKGYCDETLAKRSQQADLRAEIEHLIATRLPSGALTCERAARELGMSARTMARRLTESGTSFSRILDEVRRKLALRYLAEPEARPSQIAYLLGYSEQSAFNHAFARWTGLSPSKYASRTER